MLYCAINQLTYNYCHTSSDLDLNVDASKRTLFLKSLPKRSPFTFGPPSVPYRTHRPSTAITFEFFSQKLPPTQSNIISTPFPNIQNNL